MAEAGAGAIVSFRRMPIESMLRLCVQILQLSPPRLVSTSLHSRTQSEFVTIDVEAGSYLVVVQGSVPGVCHCSSHSMIFYWPHWPLLVVGRPLPHIW